MGARRRGGQRQDQEGAGGRAGRPGRGGLHRPPERPRLQGCAGRTSASAGTGSLPGHPPHAALRPGGRRGSPAWAAGGRGTRRRRLRGPTPAGLPWLLWGLAPGAAANWPPSPPTCPSRHVGRKRRVTQRPNGCRGGSGGSGRRCQPRAAAAPGGRGRRAAGGAAQAAARYGGLAGPRGLPRSPAGRCGAWRASCGAAPRFGLLGRLHCGGTPPIPQLPPVSGTPGCDAPTSTFWRSRWWERGPFRSRGRGNTPTAHSQQNCPHLQLDAINFGTRCTDLLSQDRALRLPLGGFSLGKNKLKPI